MNDLIRDLAPRSALLARAPRWVLAEGLIDPPHDDEPFRVYWIRSGFTPEDIDRAFQGLTQQTAELAHARIASRLLERNRDEFDIHISALLLEHHGRRYDPLYWL